MANSNLSIAVQGGYANVDSETQSGGDHRQVVCIGDPSATASAAVDSTGNLRNRAASSSSSTVTTVSVAATTANASLLAANTSRIVATFYNASSATINLSLGSSASATVYTVPVPPGGYYEAPYGYTGAITGYNTGGSAGDMNVTQVAV